MKNLTHNDFQTILKAIEILNSDVEPQTLPERLLHSVNCAVAGDITAFEMLSPTGEHQGVLIYDPVDSVSAQELEIYGQHLDEHPFYEQILSNQRFDAIKIADFSSDEKFMRTGIYNEYYRRVGISRQMTVTMKIAEDCLALCTVSRGGRDFNETERATLNLLSPHFAAAINNAKAFERLQIQRQNWQSIAESNGRAVIILDFEKNVKYLSRQAEKFLEKYFGGEHLKTNNLSHSLYRWAAKNIDDAHEANGYYLPPKPFVLSKNADKLTIRFGFEKGSDSVNLLLDEEPALSPERLLYLGLTKKETEILFWITYGKTNHEIGFLCAVSPRTVQKHVEHICVKLGVENRTAAAMRAAENIL